MLDELAHRAFDAFNSHDLDTLLELLHEDVRVHSLMTEAERQDYHGHKGVREWQAAVFDVFPDWCPQPREVHAVGDDAVVVQFDVTATAAGSGVRLEQGYWLAAHVRDGLIDFYGFYRREQDALEALGPE